MVSYLFNYLNKTGCKEGKKDIVPGQIWLDHTETFFRRGGRFNLLAEMSGAE